MPLRGPLEIGYTMATQAREAKRPTLTDRPKRLILLVPVKGIEPSTFALQVRKKRRLSTFIDMHATEQNL